MSLSKPKLSQRRCELTHFCKDNAAVLTEVRQNCLNFAYYPTSVALLEAISKPKRNRISSLPEEIARSSAIRAKPPE